MRSNPVSLAENDRNGDLRIPIEIKEAFGFTPGATVRVEFGNHEVQIMRSSDQLARVFVEPTNHGQLDIR
ncbi:MAG: hypothetical protein A2032_02715 [Chloroflexi bacterium RBG_19FT_COMBO_49_13]|nr:MAG: hypothetical protein A2032_02715 [Chloroflexi bacterium RBG_19FT_COMBO_49_13]